MGMSEAMRAEINKKYESDDESERRVAELIEKMMDDGLISENPDGTVTVKGTRQQLANYGMDPDALFPAVEEALGHAEQELELAEKDVHRLNVQRQQTIQQIAYLQQQAGEEIEIYDDNLYYMRPIGEDAKRPFGILGQHLRKYADRGIMWQFMSQEELLAHANPDGTADVDIFVGYEEDMTVEIMEPRDWQEKPRFMQF